MIATRPIGPCRTVGLVAALAGSLLLASSSLAQVTPASVTEIVPADSRVEAARAAARDLSLAFNAAAETIEPSVVHITARTDRPVVRRDIFGRAVRDRVQRSGLGSGVIVSGDGFVVTNNHVVAGFDTLTVRLMDGREFEAEVIGSDRATDLAVLHIEASGLTPARFADSDRLLTGEWVLAVGSPFGFASTVTSGIVSAKGRTGLGQDDADRFEDFIQTDAAINPGNSGGPLVDLEGRVVGINTAIFSRSGGSNGIGFAIPSNMVRTVLDAIRAQGRVVRGWLGVEMRDLTPAGIQRYGLEQTGGVYVGRIVEQSPAYEAGLLVGDIITRVDGKPVRDANRLRQMIALAGPGQALPLEVVRNDETIRVTAALTDAASGIAASIGGTGSRELGVIVEALDAQWLERLGYRADAPVEGVVVLQVLTDSPAATAGIEPGDVLVSIDGRSVVDEDSFLQAAEGTDFRNEVEVRLIRKGYRGFVKVGG
ncbi:MAG: trypsin-like peptidase domain-containing protein [Phycisphaerales bacterium JB037]